MYLLGCTPPPTYQLRRGREVFVLEWEKTHCSCTGAWVARPAGRHLGQDLCPMGTRTASIYERPMCNCPLGATSRQLYEGVSDNTPAGGGGGEQIQEQDALLVMVLHSRNCVPEVLLSRGYTRMLPLSVSGKSTSDASAHFLCFSFFRTNEKIFCFFSGNSKWTYHLVWFYSCSVVLLNAIIHIHTKIRTIILIITITLNLMIGLKI